MVIAVANQTAPTSGAAATAIHGRRRSHPTGRGNAKANSNVARPEAT